MLFLLLILAHLFQFFILDCISMTFFSIGIFLAICYSLWVMGTLFIEWIIGGLDNKICDWIVTWKCCLMLVTGGRTCSKIYVSANWPLFFFVGFELTLYEWVRETWGDTGEWKDSGTNYEGNILQHKYHMHLCSNWQIKNRDQITTWCPERRHC